MYIKTTRFNLFDSIEIKESLFKEFKIPDHFHDTYCIGLLSQGTKKSIVEGNQSIVHSNSVTIVNPYQVHSDENYNLDSCLFRMIYINKEVINFMARKITGLNDYNILFSNELITDPLISETILDFFNPMKVERYLEQKLYFLIKSLLEHHKGQIDQSVAKDNSLQNAISDSVFYARINFVNKIEIDKMAAACKLSKFQFIRYFKKMTGLTPAAYMIICRINYAKSLLVKGSPIGIAALEAGFYDHSQFCKFFKYFTGLTPIEYQKNCNIIQAGN